jgi:hypothetical protein
MGIEPTRTALPELENKRFGARPNPKCDGRVNFRGTWGNVGMRWCRCRVTSFPSSPNLTARPYLAQAVCHTCLPARAGGSP